jgi:hypothetical protein
MDMTIEAEVIRKLSARVASIMSMKVDELTAAWELHCRGKPPPHLPHSLLARLLAYKLQADALGDLPRDAQRLLDKVGQQVDEGMEPDLRFGEQSRFKPGTILVREHAGEQHRVMVLADGFAWKGQVHKSLSAVATAITGTSWNGYRFFGLVNGRTSNGNGAIAGPTS